MVRFGADDDLQGAEIVGADMSGARIRFTTLADVDIRQAYLTRAVMRGVDLTGADIDGEIEGLVINGVEVMPLVEAELDRSWPGRALRTARHVAGQHSSWQAVQQVWERTLGRVAAMPADTVDLSVDGEWSLAQTLRHLVFATDGWLRFGVQGNDDAFHPIGVPFSDFEEDAPRLGIDMAVAPSWKEVLEVRAERVAQVETFFATATDEQLAAAARRPPPWEAGRRFAVWQCLGVILDEEWAHLRFAVRDLDAIEAGRATPPT